MTKKLRNRCQCNQCKDIIESKHRHDFVRCKCGAIFTDGGTDYVRRGYTNKSDIIDLSEDNNTRSPHPFQSVKKS